MRISDWSSDVCSSDLYPMLTIDGWPGFSEAERLKPILADRAFRDRVREDLKEPKGTRIFNGQWHLVEVTISADPKHEGRHVAEIAKDRKSVGSGKGVAGSVDLGGPQNIKKKKT